MRHGSCRKNVMIITYISEATSVTSAFDRVFEQWAEAYNIVRDVYTLGAFKHMGEAFSLLCVNVYQPHLVPLVEQWRPIHGQRD